MNISDFIVFQSSQVLQIRLGFIANRKYKSTWYQVYRNTKPNQAKFCELILHVNTEKITDFDLNHQIQWFSVSFHNESLKTFQFDRTDKLGHLPLRFGNFEINFPKLHPIKSFPLLFLFIYLFFFLMQVKHTQKRNKNYTD